MAEADFVSDLNDLPDDVVSANEGNFDTNRGSGELGTPKPKEPVATTDEPAAAAKPLSLRDQISNAIKGEIDTPPAAQLDGGPIRNADGTFAQKPAASTEAPVAPVAQYPTQGLPGLSAEEFAALPAETQQHVASTMETLNGQQARFAAYNEIEQVIAPRRQAWHLNGMTEGQVFNQLFALSDFADKDPQGFIKYFAQQRGLDLEDVAFGPEPVDPVVAQLQQRLAAAEAHINGSVTQQQQAAHNSIVQEIVSFADEKGADGQPLRPYFGELGDTVLPFIQAAIQQHPGKSRSDILTAAYDAACWGNKDVRAKMQAAADAARMKEQTEAAGRARKAGVSVSGGAPADGGVAAATGTSKGNLRDDIKAAMAASS